jgi:hypothetical protein
VKNGALTPADVAPGSAKPVWWRCAKQGAHVWAAVVRRRTKGASCPFCASLRTRCPAVAAKWHPSRNGRLTPDDVTPGSGLVVWWRCDVDARHVWRAPIANVAKSERGGCPFCAGKRATSETSVAARFPEIAAEWHPTKNGRLGPDGVTCGSGRQIVWKCTSCGHVYRAAVYHRTARGDGCPACSGHVVTSKTSLRMLFPAIAREWHPTGNGELTPDAVVPGSRRRVFWRCAKEPSHVWPALVSKRTRRGDGCPFCGRKRVALETSLAALYPTLAREWHPAKNAPLTPRDVLPGSNRKVWWRCSKEPSHEWQAHVYSRTGSSDGCPICSGRRVTPKTSLAALYPTLAREWHPTKNAPLTPREVLPGSDRKVWWRCQKIRSHEWRAAVRSRAGGGHGCPMCRGRVATRRTSLRALFPAIARQWHPAKNQSLTPDDVTRGSSKRAWWVCTLDPAHVWAAPVVTRTRGHGCPMCNGSVATPKTSLRAQFPEIARQWHPTKNKPLTPDDVLPGSVRRVWWVCPFNRAHVWATCVVVRAKGHGCPTCAREGPRGRRR